MQNKRTCARSPPMELAAKQCHYVKGYVKCKLLKLKGIKDEITLYK
jgi:hypothetical protein